MSVKIYFTDFFGVSPETLDNYGAFNISLLNDLPLFIDPFLLFNSENSEYQRLHKSIIDYVKFLKSKSLADGIDEGLIAAWFMFPEVRQNWLGFSKEGNYGSGLGSQFASALNVNLRTVFRNFGTEEITRGSHLEKLCLIKDGIGRDNISDFTTNLIKEFLLEYTQRFTREHIAAPLRKNVLVRKVAFNYTTETWNDRYFELPYYNNDYLLLTPKDLLTKDDTWISRCDLAHRFEDIAASIPDSQLRSQINNYFLRLLAVDDTKEGEREAVGKVVEEYPEILDWYIKNKEESGRQAEVQSQNNVHEIENLFIEQVKILVKRLEELTNFYKVSGNTYDESYERVMYLKDVIENKDGYRIFYPKGEPIKKEEQIQLLYRLTWRGTPSDVNREVNNGRGPVDFKVSRGRSDKTLVEFKLASNSQLKRNLEKQVEIYEKASDTKRSIKVIVYFSLTEFAKVLRVLKELGLKEDPNIVLIDACKSNKPSASKA
jgi:hypothetical protein